MGGGPPGGEALLNKRRRNAIWTHRRRHSLLPCFGGCSSRFCLRLQSLFSRVDKQSQRPLPDTFADMLPPLLSFSSFLWYISTRFCIYTHAGTIAFLRSVSVEAIRLGVHLAAGAHDILLHTETILACMQPPASWPSGTGVKNIRSDQPRDAQQGLQKVVNRYIDEGVAELVPGVLFIDEVEPTHNVNRQLLKEKLLSSCQKWVKLGRWMR